MFVYSWRWCLRLTSDSENFHRRPFLVVRGYNELLELSYNLDSPIRLFITPEMYTLANKFALLMGKNKFLSISIFVEQLVARFDIILSKTTSSYTRKNADTEPVKDPRK